VTTIDLGYRPRAWQRECHRQRKRFTVLALHRRAGKTELALRELLDKALRCPLDLPLFFYVAPLLKQAKAIAWARLKQIVAPLVMSGLCEVNESELWVRLTSNGAMIRCYGADNPDAMRGVRLDGVVMDEVAQMAPEVWDDVVQPALSDRLGWALFIGTPNGINLFSQLYFGATGKSDWFAARYTVYDTDALIPEEVQRLRESMSDASFAREYMCDFSAAGSDQLISLLDVEDATRRHLTVTDYDFAAKIVGVDPARFGDDKSVIVQRQGRYMLPLRPNHNVFHKVDNMTLAAHVSEIIREWHPDAVFIDEGNGGGVIDRLRQLGHEVMGVHFGGKASRPRYVNKRTEMWFETRDWLTSGGVIPNDIGLKQDLGAPTYKFTSGQDVYSLESKDEIKKRIGRSPDLGDALALTFAWPVQRDLVRALGLPINTGISADEVLNYDPMARM
jgi:Terminase large subunit, T4likevirus-type, N-terminal